MTNEFKTEVKMGGTVEVQTMNDGTDTERTLTDNEKMLGVNSGMGELQIGADGQMHVKDSGVDTVQSQKVVDNKPVGETLRTHWGRSVDAQTALQNPEDTVITIAGSDTSLAAAINAGLVKVENGQIVETDWRNEGSESQAAPTRTNYLSDRANAFIEVAREAGSFDDAFAGVLAHVGKAESDNASKAAVTRFGQEVGSPNYDRAVETANGLIGEVMESTEKAIANKFGNNTAERAIDWMMNSMTVESRVRCFQAVLHGEPHAIDRIVEYMQLKNK